MNEVVQFYFVKGFKVIIYGVLLAFVFLYQNVNHNAVKGVRFYAYKSITIKIAKDKGCY